MKKSEDVVAFIFARGGSKGLPGKNVKCLGGKPLIAWSIDAAKSDARIRRVIVSTDSMEIAEIALKFGAEVPFLRPSELATDSSPEFLAWRHALNFLNDTEGKLPQAIISLPAASPLREYADVSRSIDKFMSGNVDAVITVKQPHRNPYFNMITEGVDGYCQKVINSKTIYRRQDAPQVWDMTTVAYVIDPEFILSSDSIFDGRVKFVEVSEISSIDIDNQIDFDFAEFIWEKYFSNKVRGKG